MIQIKQILIYQVLLLASFCLNAQSQLINDQSVRLIYSERKIEKFDIRNNSNSTLPFSLKQVEKINDVMNKSMVLFSLHVDPKESVYQFFKDSIPPEYPDVTPGTHSPLGTFYKDHSLNILKITGGKIPPNTEVINSLQELNVWEISGIDTLINDLKCTKAWNKYDNSTAWFTSDIMINSGPRQYGMLPGLIVRLEIESELIELIKIEKVAYGLKKQHAKTMQNSMNFRDYISLFD